MHSYIDEILYEITIQLASSTGYCSIDNVLVNAKFQIDDVKKCFKAKERTECVDILKLYGER